MHNNNKRKLDECEHDNIEVAKRQCVPTSGLTIAFLKPQCNLFSMCLHFVAAHIDIVESLCGFPSLVGECIFRKCAELDKFKGDTAVTNLKIFASAYPDLILRSVDF